MRTWAEGRDGKTAQTEKDGSRAKATYDFGETEPRLLTQFNKQC
jgi:hypothetical protein